ncbi:MAG: hypothetical protein QG651_1363 [Pseudomonadota bacterium]|jgi:hypothetical protein|nr:hypothetical protein [Pseudomonadota bacterium]
MIMAVTLLSNSIHVTYGIVTYQQTFTSIALLYEGANNIFQIKNQAACGVVFDFLNHAEKLM